MFILKKILTSFLLPPGIFVTVLIVSGVWFLSQRNNRAGVLNLVIGLFMWFLCLGPVANTLIRGLESGFEIPADPKGDVIVLLGAGVYDKARDLTGIGAPSDTALSRIVTTARLQRILDVPVIVSGGKVYQFKTAEAPVLRRFLIDLGVPDHMIIIEDQSRDTIENARYTREICERRGYIRPILVTSAYHLKRSVLSFTKAGLDVLPFPAGFRSWENRRYGITAYLPNGLGTTGSALKEYLGLLVYDLIY
jgi:uncharacterized SAM-binding protein YcdF (DUF218 family)